MPNDELLSEIESLFNPEIDDPDLPQREFPHERLEQHYGLNFDYLRQITWEGATNHASTRLCPENERGGIGRLITNEDVPGRLFESGLRIYADSLVQYIDAQSTSTPLRFYPPVILTFWSAFEAMVRHSSLMMLRTCTAIPQTVAEFLREEETYIDGKGRVKTRTRFWPVLDRYFTLLKYGFELDIDRGSQIWQRLEAAKSLRDYYTHVDALESRSISAAQVLEYLESLLLGVIYPSSLAQKSVLMGAVNYYWIWAELGKMTESHLPEGHAEEPFFHSWESWEGRPFLFYCPFKTIDAKRFPNLMEQR